MRFLKQLFSFTLIMLALLLSFVIYSVVGKLQDAYLKKIANEYAMFIVSVTPINQNNFEEVAGIKIVKINNVPKNQIIDTYRSKISPNSLRLLEEKLPHFYEIYLDKFPTSQEIVNIKKEFFKSPNIKKVEVFSQNHDQITSLLSFSNNITMWLFYLILFLSVLILINQIKIWFFEHNERLFIMHLHGASLLYSSFSVIKTAFLASILASAIAFGILWAIEQNATILFEKDFANVAQIEVDYLMEVAQLLALSLSVSIFAILGVIIKHKTKLS